MENERNKWLDVIEITEVFPLDYFDIERIDALKFPLRGTVGLVIHARRKSDGRYFELRSESDEIECVQADVVDAIPAPVEV